MVCIVFVVLKFYTYPIYLIPNCI